MPQLHSRGLTPLYYSVLYIVTVYYILQTFLDLGASTNYKDSRGLTPLYYSVLYGKNANCTEMLLHERAHVGVQDEQGWYEIHQVSKKKLFDLWTCSIMLIHKTLALNLIETHFKAFANRADPDQADLVRAV